MPLLNGVNHIAIMTADMERFTASSKDAQAGADSKERIAQGPTGFDQMLAGVEDQQKLALTDRAGDRREQRLSGLLANPEG